MDPTYATVEWDQEPDPESEYGTPGSGIVYTTYRYRPVGGRWSSWTITEESFFEIPGGRLGASYEVEAAATDRRGNSSNPSTATVRVVDLRATLSGLRSVTGVASSFYFDVTEPGAPPIAHTATAHDWAQPCGPFEETRRGVTFTAQTNLTDNPSVQWGWFLTTFQATAIMLENPLFRILYSSELHVNGRMENSTPPKRRGPLYLYHGSFKTLKLARKGKKRTLRYGDRVHIENWARGEDARIQVNGHLDFVCTVQR